MARVRVLPATCGVKPIGTVRDIRPGADAGDTLHQRIDVTVGPVDAIDLARDPITRKLRPAIFPPARKR